MHSILILIDDEQELKSLKRALHSEDLAISSFRKADEALIQCAAQQFDLIIADQRLPIMTGAEFLAQISANYPRTRRVLISAHAEFDDVTLAFSRGFIHQFIVKPWKNVEIHNVVQEELSHLNIRIVEDPTATDSKASGQRSVGGELGIITNDKVMIDLLEIAEKTANSEAAFFISGETGTGKEVIAKAIHRKSERHGKPFLALNCANLSEALLESQLFGHREGAFTGANKDQEGIISAANKGTLFLDEVVEIPLSLQAKLLRVLQEREFTPVGETKARKFDVKIISASSVSLAQAVSDGRFREDLRYRLEVIPLNLPPLRDRVEDIEILFDHYLRYQFERHGRPIKPVDPEVYRLLRAHSWPGNVRELINVCVYIVALSSDDDSTVTVSKLPQSMIFKPSVFVAHSSAVVSSTADRPIINRQSLQQAMHDFGGHRENIAAYFGVSRMTLWRKLKKFGLA